MTADVRAALVLAALSAAIAMPRAAAAQDEGDRLATAQGLYDAAAALIRAGRWTEACPKLEESHRLDPAMGTKFFLASCYESTGRPTSAWSLFLEVAAAAKAAGNPVRESTARARGAALEPKLPRITIVLPDAVAKLPGLTVERDDVALKPIVWGAAVPVDLGPHVVRVGAPGKERWETTVQVSALAQEVTITVPPLQDAPPPAPEPQPPREPSVARAPAPSVDTTPPPPPPPRPQRSGQRIAGLVTGSAGIAAIAAGSVLGLLARSAWNDADAACPTHRGCSRDAHDQSMHALALARGSTGAFIAGGVGLAGGVVLWLTAPSRDAKPRSSLAVHLAGGGIAGLSLTGEL